MIKASWWFLRCVVWPNGSAILISADLWIATAIGASLYRWASLMNLGTTTVASWAGALLTYSAVALGFCLTGLVLAVTMPNQEFARALARTELKPGGMDTYTKLVHVFTWAAACHWLLLVYSVVWFAVIGGDTRVQSLLSSTRSLLSVCLLVAVSVYCFFRFFIVLVTVAQSSTTYINSLQLVAPPVMKAPRKRPSRSAIDKASAAPSPPARKKPPGHSPPSPPPEP